MRKLICGSALFLVVAAIPARGQTTLPLQFSNWMSSGPSVQIGAAAVEQLSGSDAVLLREDGLLNAERRAYERDGRSLNVTVYRMRDATGAYAAFTALRTRDMVGTDLAPFSAVGKTRALLVIGQNLLDATGLDGASPAEFKDLVSSLQPSADKTPYPPLKNFLPRKEIVPGSERYVLGPQGFSKFLGRDSGEADWLGFSAGAEAILADYKFEGFRSGGPMSTLLLVEFPTPQSAAAGFKELEKRYQVNPKDLSPRERPQPVYARRKGSLLSVVFLPASPKLAQRLLDEVHFETQLTWNEPSYLLKEPPFNVMIVEAFVGTGVILIFALVAGLGFGGLRLITKYFLPGKVFDRGEGVEIIQLGISSKPIEAKDFY